jgi:hypothetical protein
MRWQQIFKSYVLPLGLFVLAIGAIAWMTQYMPNWRAQTAPAISVKKHAEGEAKPVIQFVRTQAEWEKRTKENESQPPYVREFEKGDKGHYDFPFRVVGDQPAEIGVAEWNCDCSQAQVGTLPKEAWDKFVKDQQDAPEVETKLAKEPVWEELPRDTDKKKGASLPAGAHGLLRITWDGRKGTGTRLRLLLKIWSQPAGQLDQRRIDIVDVPIVMAPPIMYIPDKAHVGALGSRESGSVEFDVWSATRTLELLKLHDPTPDPLFVVTARDLTPAEMQELQQKFPPLKISSRVKAAQRVTVTVHEQKDGKQFDQGPFARTLPVFFGETLYPDGRGPTVQGRIRGDVEVGGGDEQGKVVLKTFASRDGVVRKVPLSTEVMVPLVVESSYPPALKVKLERSEKESTKSRARWWMTLDIPPGAVTGTLPENSAVVLQLQTTPPRLLRIPIVGSAVAD